MNETVYDESHPYDGKDFMDVLRAMDAHQLKLTLKSAYRKEGKKVKRSWRKWLQVLLLRAALMRGVR